VNSAARRLAAALLAATLFTLPLAGPAGAQQMSSPSIGDPNAPLEIEADNGLELYQDRQLVVAKGNVVATQGTVVLRADILSASYEESGGERRVKRLDAVGNVRIQTGQERLYGEHATYDLTRELMVVTGEDMRIETEQQTIEADESLEFWGAEQRAVARGNAVVTQGTTSLRADLIEALLKTQDGGSRAGPTAIGVGEGSGVERVRAWGNVRIRTPSEIVEGDEGDYDVVNQVAVLTGNVRISRGKNQLNGHKAVVDLKAGVSRLAGGDGNRVRTILFPNSDGEGNLAPPDPQEPRQATEPESGQAETVETEATQPETSAAADAQPGLPAAADIPLPRPRPEGRAVRTGLPTPPLRPAEGE